MKKYNILALALLATLFVSSCVDMNTYPEGSTVTSDQKGQVVNADPAKAAAGVNGIYSQFNSYMGAVGESVGRHNDFGYPAVMLIMDSDGFDHVMADSGFAWFAFSLDYSNRLDNYYEIDIMWNTLYSMIYTTNTVIAGIPESEDPTAQFYLAQGYAARAFDYWVLAQVYQFNYADNKSKPCVPLVTEQNSNDVAVSGAARASVEAVYTQILSDINKAIELLEDSGVAPADKRYIGLDVAYGLRARVDLTMENWASAAQYAEKAINASSASPYTIAQASRPAFMDSHDNNFMWADVVAETDDIVSSGIVNWPSHMGSLNWGYGEYAGSFQINKALYNSIPDTDVRKGWWLDENQESANLTDLELWFVSDAYNGYSPYTQVKFAPYGYELETSVNANDIPLMRIEEMYLIKAEGEAMSGKGALAKATIEDFVQTYRDPEYTFNVGSAEEMQEQIWMQRRIELWGEGLSWFDIMRLKKNVDRRGAGYPDAFAVLNIQYGDPAMLWRLPVAEIQANPALTEADNNPAANIPQSVPDFDD